MGRMDEVWAEMLPVERDTITALREMHEVTGDPVVRQLSKALADRIENNAINRYLKDLDVAVVRGKREGS